ncbi:MAG TPA: ribokinase, partial [Paracoccaceae bacterium]|nr:ribokinase [Paracoccaceae bacterium]
NQAVAAAMAGGRVQFLSRLGADPFADIARETWARAGVTPEITEDPDSYTGAAFVFVEHGTGNNAIVISPGAGGRISAADMEARAELIASAAVFITQLEQPMEAALRAMQIARAGGARTILNPAPAAPLPLGMLALADIVTPNGTEVEALTGLPVADLDGAARAAAALVAQGAGAALITLGARGALWHGGGQTVHVPPFAAGPVVDTTGAGDAFNGGFAVALAEGADPVTAVRFASATAALSVTRAGTAASMPARAEIEALLAR